MSGPQPLSELLLKVAAAPNDPFAKMLRRCPFIQAALIQSKRMNLDELTDEQIDRLIEWDQSENPQKAPDNE